METKQIIETLIDMTIDNTVHSKVKGNRNWCIRTSHYFTPDGQEIKKAIIGRYGALDRRGLLSVLIKNIVKYNIKWYDFTYKKDVEKMETILAENGYYIKWI